MRKVFPGLSFTGGAFLFSALFFGFFFRLLGLASVSAWGDEMASWYFALDLGAVFSHESHTPLSYFFNRLWLSVFPGGVLSLRYFSVVSNALLTALAVGIVFKRQSPRKAYLLFVLWWLWPLAVMSSRQARHYGAYADLTLLVLIAWSLRGELHRWAVWFLLCLSTMLHPFALIPMVSLLGADLLLRRLPRKDFFFFATSALPVCVYYGLRFLTLGQEKVLSNIQWITSSAELFYGALVLLFGGDSFPHKKFYPLAPLPVFLLLVVTLLTLLGGSPLPKLRAQASPMLRTGLVIVLTVFVVELSLLLGVDLRVNRYFIYLVPAVLYFLWELADGERFFEARIALLCVALVSFNAFVLRPWADYDWDDDHVARFLELKAQLPEKKLVICGSPYQLRYYFQREASDCRATVIGLHQRKQDFYLFDLNGSYSVLPILVSREVLPVRFESFGHARFFSFSYSKEKDHGSHQNSHHRGLQRHRPGHGPRSGGEGP